MSVHDLEAMAGPMLDAFERAYCSEEAVMQRLLYGANVFEIRHETNEVRVLPFDQWPAAKGSSK